MNSCAAPPSDAERKEDSSALGVGLAVLVLVACAADQSAFKISIAWNVDVRSRRERMSALGRKPTILKSLPSLSRGALNREATSLAD